MPRASMLPTPTPSPKEGASFLPGCCLSLLSFPSRSRKRCHPGLCCTPPAFLFLAQELASSFPWPAALAPQPAGEQPRQALHRGQWSQSAHLLFCVLSAALGGRDPGISHRCLTVGAAHGAPG